jgi:threonine dehydrogenase-like Zn-dependent dehydrogenase
MRSDCVKAVFFPGDREAIVKDVADPKPDRGQALIRMKASGICGSDLGFLYRLSKEERSKPSLGIALSPDVIPGHEACGVVEELGPGVRHIREGDRVIVYHTRGCGRCKYCRSGFPIHCALKKAYGFDIDGGFADLIVADDSDCIALPKELDFVDGAYCACAAGTAYKASKRVGIRGLDTIALFGLGPVGLAGVLIGKAMGATVIGVEINEYRLTLAKKAGADHVINSNVDDPVKRIMELTNGEGADVAIDYSANPIARSKALDCTKIWGRMAFVGEGGKVTIEPSMQIIHKQLNVYGSFVFSTAELQELLATLVRYRLRLNEFVTHRCSIEDAPEALRLFDKGESGKVVFIWT